MGFKNFRKQDMQFGPRIKVEEMDLEATKRQLDGERAKKSKDRMPMFEAYLELQVKVLSNEARRMQGLPAQYAALYF